MEQIWNEVSPMLSQLVIEIIKILTVVVLAGLGLLQFKIKSAIDTIKNKNQREIFHKIANEAFAHAETVFKSESSRNKMAQAFIYASSKLGDIGINVSDKEITAAIERACLEYNAKKKLVIEDKAS
ncbi:phage holin [Paenibacillus dakarensis]|uniref:phage holin n=1 Tax=Paenibacillus dakarensis TaxID=1527293 RepID=UPI0006D5B3D9|nr:phage holin [Paenibacillus dakarensis]